MISNQDLSTYLKVTPQRISALAKTVNVLEDESVLKGRTRIYSRAAVRKLLAYRGVEYAKQRVIAVSNNKGGVGKTSITTSLAKRLHNMGFDVLVIDIDPQANSTNFLLDTDAAQKKVKHAMYDVITKKCRFADAVVEVEEGFTLLPSSLANSRLETELGASQKNPSSFIKNLISESTANFVLFDMSPSFSQVNFLCSLAADLVIIPSLLTKFSVEGVKMTLESISAWLTDYPSFRPEVRVIINQLDSRLSSQLSHVGDLKEALSRIDQLTSADLFSTVIRSDNTINRIQSGTTAQNATSNFHKDIAQLAEELVGLKSLPADL